MPNEKVIITERLSDEEFDDLVHKIYFLKYSEITISARILMELLRVYDYHERQRACVDD